MKDCINIGLLGVGTVGSGVLHVLEHNGGEIAKKAGFKIEIIRRKRRSLAKNMPLPVILKIL